MASQIKREHVFGNFKKSRTEGPQKPHKNSEKYKDRPGMSEAHCAGIRKLPCAICLKVPGGEIHHLKGYGSRGMGLRTEDRYGVPLCRICHNMVEAAGTRNEFKLFKEHHIDNVHLLSDDLWGVSPDVPKMIKVLMAHRGHK